MDSRGFFTAMSLLRPPPYELLLNLTCSQCKDGLSCDPVKILPNNEVLCGRCSRDNSHVQAVRSPAFEDIANYFIYPCRYPSCKFYLQRCDVIDHEMKCATEQSACCLCWKRCCGDAVEWPSPEGMYLVKATDKTHELLTCTHCFGYLSAPPIFIRPNSTYICCRCGPDLQTPPIMRDIALETLMKCFVIKCSYRENGCRRRLQFGEDMIQHETVCVFNPQRRMEEQHRFSHQFEGGSDRGKKKGVISTISSGHIYATITPNHFANKYNVDPNALKEFQQMDHPVRMEQLPRVHGQQPQQSASHSQQESYDMTSRSSIMVENHQWDMYTGEGVIDNPPRPISQMKEEAPKYAPKIAIKHINLPRKESMLYNNVVTEMKFKQRKKQTAADSENGSMQNDIAL